MVQCKGITKKGERCKREARSGSDYCAIHIEQEVRARPAPPSDMEWDREAMTKAAVGFALVGAILFFRLKR